MENGPPTIGFEDGTIDVERLLVEPQDGHVSVDSVMCFNEKIPENVMDMEDVTRSFGVTNNGIAQEGEHILNRDVLDSVSSEVEVGYFRLQNDFCSMGEEYLLGYTGFEFAESITNLDYGSSECLQTSVSDNPVPSSSAGMDTPWKTDLFRIMELPNDQLNVDSSDFGEIPSLCHESETLAEEKPLKSPISCTLQDIGKFQDISSCSFQDILSDGNDTSLSPSVEMFCNPKSEKNDEFRVTGQNGEANNALETTSTRASCSGALPTQKRSRKPTQRYIDELADPISRHSKRRREVSSSILKHKSPGVKDHKKCHIRSREVILPAEESSVVAIQVPFGSLVHKECPKSPADDMVRCSDRGNPIIKSKDNLVTPENQKRRDECNTAVRLKKRDDNIVAASQKKRDENGTAAHLKKRDDRLVAPSKKKIDCVLAASPKKKVDCLIRQEKIDDYPTAESPEEVNGRRKHHRLWTIAEVKKLIDGVSEYGVGRWSRIKKLFFSASAHRTSVDLKDKWRNLLKASGLQGQGNRQGEKKRNLAWRPLPKSILRRVCELATMYPYPKGRKHKIAHIHRDSPDRSTDITLNDYRKILRSINEN
uniref:Telomere repeat-binding factor like-protein n=1 Tax=Rehmannia glutinosa TaxID=99300 RepID=A0A0K1SB99_REHGL|nr:telomere repeat-binding factor like-protein [Rehmannia glutinosa]